MKRVGVICCVLLLIMAVPSMLLAGGLVNRTNLSVEYLRTLNRQAATDHADIVEFNPAGTVKLKDGFTVNASVMDLITTVGNTDNPNADEFTSTESNFVPAVYAVYKKRDWAGFFGFNVPLGGGKVDFDKGNVKTVIGSEIIQAGAAPFPTSRLDDPTFLEAQSYGLGFTLGGAYRINKLVSMSLAARYINSKQELKARIGMTPIGPIDPTAEADVSLDANGWGGVIGLDFFPQEWLTIGLVYQSQVDLEYDIEYNPDSTNTNGEALLATLGYSDGGAVRGDLPAVFGAGADVKITDRLRYEVSFRYYFNKAADLGQRILHGTTTLVNLNEYVHDSIEFGIGVEYAFNPKFKGSLGYLFSSAGGNAEVMNQELPELDTNTFAGGFGWEVVRDLNLQFAAGWSFYPSQTTSDGRFTYDRNVPFFGLGAEYTF